MFRAVKQRQRAHVFGFLLLSKSIKRNLNKKKEDINFTIGKYYKSLPRHKPKTKYVGYFRLQLGVYKRHHQSLKCYW